MSNTFQNQLSSKQAVKIIAGISNFDLPKVLKIVNAATLGGADAVDISDSDEVIKAAREATDIGLFVSSIQPQRLAAAVELGADYVELGNYDALYAEGIFIPYEEVLRLAEKTVSLVQGKAGISVTIPGHLSLTTQGKMIRELDKMGIDIIQTEGAARAVSALPEMAPLTSEEKAQFTFNNTRHLAELTTTPLMTASGINVLNAAEAFTHGASAIGVGSAISQLSAEVDMITEVQAIVDAVQARVEKKLTTVA